MADLLDGETVEIKGSAAKPYLLRNTGGVFSCTCPAWRNQSIGIEQRTCKHLRKFRGDAAETARIGNPLPQKPKPTKTVVNEDGTETEAAAGPGVLLAQSWTNDIDLVGWWMSEKLDGVRAYWDGTQFISRQGNLFYAPDWFIEKLPKVPLDGELWLARKSFQRTVSIVRRQDKSDLWRELKYVVFDAPAVPEPFEQRLTELDKLLATAGDFVHRLEHQACRNVEHLREELARVEGLGGEGLMLRQPGSLYEAGRSMTLLKVKSFHDAEATVIDHLAGAGRHKGRLGALAVQLADGTRFSVGTGFSDAQRDNPPAIGSLITFRYQELTDGGVPRFPSFVRLRTDLDSSAGGNLPAQPVPAATRKPAAVTKVVATPVASETGERGGVSPPSLSGSDQPLRHFELIEGNAAKFWEISVTGAEVTVRYGRIGTNGQSNVKTLASAAAASVHAAKLIEEKTGKGYVESDGGAE